MYTLTENCMLKKKKNYDIILIFRSRTLTLYAVILLV